MQNLLWWNKLSPALKLRAVQMLNREVVSWEIKYDPKLPGAWDRFGRYWQDNSARAAQIFPQILTIREAIREALKNGDPLPPLPPDIRRCRYKPCSRFFLVPKNRLNRVYCSPKKCGANYRMNKKNARARTRKLKRVRTALKAFRHLPDWQERTARKARVTKNFITYAIRGKSFKK
jgi:hypothetical protein